MNLEEWLNEVPPADWVKPEDVSGHLLSREQLESLWQAAHAEGVAEGRAAERKKWQDENSTLRKRLETRTQISRQWEALAERNRLERTAATAAERERCASRALAIVNAILEDLTDRRGLSQEWEHIDIEIQMEIINAWKDAVVAVITEADDEK